MRTKDLIKILQDADPSGEIECCAGNHDIHFVSEYPAYYDGPLQVLVRDEACKFYNITGVKVIKSGKKIQIHTLSLNNAIENDPKVSVFTDFEDPDFEAGIQEWRDEVISIKNEVDAEFKKAELDKRGSC